MAAQIFENTASGMAAALAIADPKHLQVMPARNRIVVLTGDDLPAALDPRSVFLSRMQLFEGFLLVGQPLLTAAEAYIEDQKINGSTPRIRSYWKTCDRFARRHAYINQLRIAVQGAKTNAASLAEMDQVFVLGSGYEPSLTP